MKKRIIMVRHASAVRRGGGDEDFDRSLRGRGRREAAAVATWYARFLEAPDRMLSSPADRALETARIFADILSTGPVATDRRIYDAHGPDDLLEVLRGLEEPAGSVMVFGHDPVFTDFAAAMAPPFDQAVPKCGLVVIETRRRRWSTLRPGESAVSVFQHPAALKAAKRARRDARERLGRHIEAAVGSALADFGVSPGDDDRESVRRASARLAKRFSGRLTGEEQIGERSE